MELKGRDKCEELAAGIPSCPRSRLFPIAASIGGNVRLGLADSLWDGPERLAKSLPRAHRLQPLKRGLGGASLCEGPARGAQRRWCH